MIASILAWGGAVAAIGSIVIILLKWYIGKSPERKDKRRRAANREIAKRLRAGDLGWLRSFMQRLRDSGP